MNKQILIIDDSKTCQLIARETLKHLGQITKAMNIHEARECLLSKTFDIVIFDVFLPDGSGVEFLGELRTMDISQNSIFIVTTSDTEVSKKIAAFSLGADDYLTKPYSPLELRARVERYLKVHSRDLFADVRSGLRLNTANYRAFKTTAGQERDLSLTPQEFKNLRF